MCYLKKYIFFAFIYLVFTLNRSCQSSSKKQVVLDESKGEVEADLQKISNGVVFTYSFSNNSLTPFTVSHKKVLMIEKKNRLKKNNIESLRKHIFFSRLKGKPTSEVLKLVQKVGERLLSKNINNRLSDDIKLELVLSCLKNNKLNLAYYLLDSLKESKDNKIRSGALNIFGFLAAKEERIPEAVYYWKEALRYTSTYEPAILNLGFTALKYGDFDTADQMLSRVKESSFILYAKAIIYRLMGELEKTTSLCRKFLKQKRKYKPLIFNCGIHQWQSNNDALEARKLIHKALKLKQGPSTWNQFGQKVLKRVR